MKMEHLQHTAHANLWHLLQVRSLPLILALIWIDINENSSYKIYMFTLVI